MPKYLPSLSIIFFILFIVSCGDESDENPQTKVTITAISPDKGLPGTDVTITGTGFSPVKAENIVTLGSVSVEVITATEKQLVVRIPEDGVTSPIVVKVNNSEASSLTFKVQKMPLILAAPVAGSIGSTFVMDAKYVGPEIGDNVVKVNGAIAEVVTINKYTSAGDPEQRYQLTVKVPVVESGPVTLSYDGLQVTVVDHLTIEPYPTDFSPKGGAAGTVVTITGLNFKETVGQNTISVGGKTAIVTSASKTQVQVQVGGSPSEFGMVVVNNVVAPGFFTGTAIPALSPSTGPVGTWVILYNMKAGPEGIVVKFNGVTATELDLADGIKARVPAGATTGPVTMSLNGFTSVSKTDFTVQ
jgi:hypothetical protein